MVANKKTPLYLSCMRLLVQCSYNNCKPPIQRAGIINWSDPETRGEQLVKKITPISSARAQIIIFLHRVVAFIIYIWMCERRLLFGFALSMDLGAAHYQEYPHTPSHFPPCFFRALRTRPPRERPGAGQELKCQSECVQQKFSLDQAGMQAHGSKSPLAPAQRVKCGF